MPNLLSPTGLQIVTKSELTTKFNDAMKTIYGVDINLSPDTPDAQFIQIFVQAILDNAELIQSVYTSFDPDQAIGVTLDQRVNINGISRQAGTFTVTPVTIVTDRACTLFGLDQGSQTVYAVADNAGNQWQLIATQNIPSAGTYVFQFQSKIAGKKLTIPNTITVPKTIVLGVVSINNPTTYPVLGIDEETDVKLKLRRAKSVKLASQGYLDGLIGALNNINGIESAYVYENKTGGTDENGVPSHSIWVIVSGTASQVDIATAIYQKRNAGCGMYGTQSYTIIQIDGSKFVVNWDIVEEEDLYVKFTASSLDGINPPNLLAIRAGLVTSFAPAVFEQININDLATAVQLIDNNCLVTAAGFGLTATGSFVNVIKPSVKNKQFRISAENIIITPIVVIPGSVTISALNIKQFSAYGGFGAYVWTMDANPSGGSINSTGLYTAGAVTGSDVVRVTDDQGNFTLVAVSVL